MEQPRISLNTDTNFLKLVAIATMLCDHIGKILFPRVLIYQIIGRIAFPIFAYCVVVGCLYTRDIKRYMLRLCLFFLVSQPIYTAAFQPWPEGFVANMFKPNIFLTLVVGVAVIWGIREQKWWLSAAAVVMAILAKTAYGLDAIVLMVSFYLFRKHTFLSFLVVGVQLCIPFLTGYQSLVGGISVGVQGFAVFSMPFIYMKTRLHPPVNQYFFYIFYPAHLAVLLLIKAMI